MVVELKEDNFDANIVKNEFSLVDFWAPWCGPCRMMGPVFSELSEDTNFKNVGFYKVNVDENSDLSSKFRVSSIPCFILFKKGTAIATKVGGGTKSDFSSWLSQEIKNAK